MNKPLVSVIIPTCNRAGLVLQAVKSVLKQTYPNLEILICDDGSTDNTKESIKSVKDKKITYLRQENMGSGAARNLGIRNSAGKLIAFLDDDDQWLPEHIEYCVKFFELYPEAGMVYTQSEVVYSGDSRRKPARYKRLNIPYQEKKEGFRLYDGLVFGHYLAGHVLNQLSCTIVKRDVLEKTGLFNEEIRNGQDYELWMRISNKFRIGVVKKVTVIYLAHAAAISETVSRKTHLENQLKIFKSVRLRCDLSKKQKDFVDRKIAGY